MKRKLWLEVVAALALALLAGPVDMMAQEAVIGIKGGFDSYDLRWKPDSVAPSLENKTGFLGGAFGGLTFTRVLGVQAEVLYSQRKVRDRDEDSNLEVSYWEVPLLLTAKFPIEGTSLRPILFAGPSLSFESKCEVSGEMEGVNRTFDCDGPQVAVERTKTDWAIVFGGGVDYPVGALLIGGEWRYGLGLTNLNDSDSRDVETVKSRSWAILLSVGYRL